MMMTAKDVLTQYIFLLVSQKNWAKGASSCLPAQ
jgi:hypothetical protein